MKRLLFLSLLMMLGVALAFLSGCDEDGTEPTEKAVGDTLDPVFLVAASGFEFASDMTPWFIGQNLETAFFILYDTSESGIGKGTFGLEGLASASDSVIYDYDSVFSTYHSNSQYWYFYVSFVEIMYSGETIEDSSDVTAEDSIQFLHGATPVQWPDSAELTAIKAGGSLSMYSLLHADTLLFSQYFTLLGDIPDTGDVVGTGNGQVTTAGDFVSDSLGSCHGSLTMTQTISNVEFNLNILDEEDGCPTAGTIRYNGTLQFECNDETSFAHSDTWTITSTFSGDLITTVLENSTTVWTVIDSCGDGPAAAPWSRFKEIGKRLD